MRFHNGARRVSLVYWRSLLSPALFRRPSNLLSFCWRRRRRLVSAGLNHWFYNADPLSDCLFEVRLEPALAGDEFFEQIAGLSRDYGAASKVNPLQLMALFAAYDVDVGFMPPAVWRVVKRVVVPLADVLGFKTKYPEYRSAGGGGNAPRAATLRQRLAGEIEGITSQKAAEAAVVEE